MFEGDFTRYSSTTYWFTGTGQIKDTLITQKPPELPHQDKYPTTRSPEIGERFSSVRDTSDGGPTDGGNFENVLWLAFCSGNYLKNDEHRTVPPIGVSPKARYLQDCSQTISRFTDPLSLPKQLDLLAPDKHLLCHYEVEQSTNFAGWNLPQKFKVIQHRPGRDGTWEPDAQAVGRLISIRSVSKLENPVEVLKK